MRATSRLRPVASTMRSGGRPRQWDAAARVSAASASSVPDAREARSTRARLRTIRRPRGDRVGEQDLVESWPWNVVGIRRHGRGEACEGEAEAVGGGPDKGGAGFLEPNGRDLFLDAQTPQHRYHGGDQGLAHQQLGTPPELEKRHLGPAAGQDRSQGRSRRAGPQDGHPQNAGVRLVCGSAHDPPGTLYQAYEGAWDSTRRAPWCPPAESGALRGRDTNTLEEHVGTTKRAAPGIAIQQQLRARGSGDRILIARRLRRTLLGGVVTSSSFPLPLLFFFLFLGYISLTLRERIVGFWHL